MLLFVGKPRIWSSVSKESVSIHGKGLPDSVCTNAHAV